MEHFDLLKLQEWRHIWWIKIALPGSLVESLFQATGSSSDHLEGYLWAKKMEALRGLVCPTFLAFCGLLDNMSGFLFLRLLSAIKAPKLARPMAVHLQHKAFGYYKLILVKLWKKSLLFLGLVNPFPCHVKYHFFHWRDTVQNWKVWL